MTDIEELIAQKNVEKMTKKDSFLCEVIDNYNKLKEENKELRKGFEELISDLGWHCVQCTKEADNCMLRIENEKQKDILKEIKQITKNQDLYRGRQALATKILQIIENVDQTESEER